MRRLVAMVGMLVLALAAFAAPSSARAESLEVNTGGSATQDIAHGITVSGVADGHHRLYVLINGFGGACASMPAYDGGSSLAAGTTLAAGSFEKSYSYTPTSQQTYTVCAYLDEEPYSKPDVTAAGDFTAAAPAASAAIEVSGKLTQNVPMKISVTGNSEVARKLYVLVNSYGGACSSVPAYDGGIPLANGTAIAAGLYQGEYTYTPTAIQTYTVCAYVDEEPYAKPDAMTSISFAAGRPAASISLYVNPASVENGPITITDTGSAEVPRKLYVLVNSYGGACASVPAYDGGTPLANGTSLAAGPFSGTYTYTPTSTGTYTVCGYIDEETYATPDASASVTFSNVTPSTRAKEHEEAAAKAAGEAEAAVAAKKRAEYLQGVAARGHCEQLSSGYTRADLAACEADEAAIRAGEEAVWAREAAQWAALEAVDLNKPVRSLSVSASAHPGRSSSRPGHSTLRIHTSPFAEVTIVIRRYGHRSERYHAVPASLSSSNSVIQVEYAWSCKRPGSSYRYSVIAKTHAGAALTRRGRFAPVSVARCHALELAEQQARERSQREYAERVRGEREAEEATRREGERNCRVRGGTVVELIVEGESRIGCRAPSGGLLPWIP